jgi:hypothetical protein
MITLSSQLIERLLPNAPFRALFRRDPSQGWVGLVEYSFSMDWSPDRALILWSGKYFSNIGTTGEIDAVEDGNQIYQTYRKQYPNDLLLLVDPTTPDCPFEINWEAWLNATNKFNKRNAPFKAVDRNNAVPIKI